jgi:phospholipid/cholesterol/gamma-HCH transport system substrate-binding protein
MRTRKKDQKNLIKVGFFVAGLTLILMIMITSIGKERSIFDEKITITGVVSNVSNLKPGSYVELMGIRIGSVESIEIISQEAVQIRMTILERELKWIKADSKITISTAGLVGDKYVEIYKGTNDAAIFNPAENVLLADESAGLQMLMDKGDSIASSTDRILSKLDNVLVKLGDGSTIVDTMNSLNRASGNMEKITTQLREANMGQMVSSVTKASASFEKILQRIEKGPGTMNSLIYDESVHDDLRALLGGAQRNKVIKYFIRDSIRKSEDRKPQKN